MNSSFLKRLEIIEKKFTPDNLIIITYGDTHEETLAQYSEIELKYAHIIQIVSYKERNTN